MSHCLPPKKQHTPGVVPIFQSPCGRLLDVPSPIEETGCAGAVDKKWENSSVPDPEKNHFKNEKTEALVK